MRMNRMRRGLSGLILAGVMVGATDAGAEPGPGETEPLQQFVVELGGQTLVVEAGETVWVTVGGERQPLVIEPTGERTFDNGVLSYTYADEMAFAFDDSVEGLKQWYFDGQDCVIILQQVDDQTDFETYRTTLVQEMVAGYGAMFEGSAPVEIEVDGQKLTGEKITANMTNFEIVIVQYIYFFEHGGKGGSMILQDTLLDDGSHTAEFMELKRRLETTLRWSEGGEAEE